MVVICLSQNTTSNNVGGKNQHLPCRMYSLLPPFMATDPSYEALESMLKPILTTFFSMGISDVEIVKLAALHFDKHQYGLR